MCYVITDRLLVYACALLTERAMGLGQIISAMEYATDIAW